MSDYPPNQPPHNYYPPPQQPAMKEPGISSGFKLVIGGCLALIVISGVIMVGCSIMVGGLAGLGSREQRKSTSTPSSPSSTPQAKSLTLEQFNKIQDNMSYSQVVAILGKEGKVAYDSKSGNLRTTSYTWDCGSFCSLSAIFQNDKLISKSQHGLN